jgi:hypothetical protein
VKDWTEEDSNLLFMLKAHSAYNNKSSLQEGKELISNNWLECSVENTDTKFRLILLMEGLEGLKIQLGVS